VLAQEAKVFAGEQCHLLLTEPVHLLEPPQLQLGEQHRLADPS
jgi:hypothetical protein